MDDIFEDFSEEETTDPECPICGKYDCVHLVAILDFLYGECEGGFLYGNDALRTAEKFISDAFAPRLERGEAEPPFKANEHLHSLYQEAKLTGDSEMPVEFYHPNLYRYFSYVFDACDVTTDYSESGSGPGFSSVSVFHYAKQPSDMIAKWLERIKTDLDG